MVSSAVIVNVVVRSILIILLLIEIVASGSTIGFGTSVAAALGTGGWLLSLAILALFYEVMMLALSAQKDSAGARVTADIVVSTLFALGFAFGSISLTVIAARSFFLLFPLTPGYISAITGFLLVLGFIFSAIAAGFVRPKRSDYPGSVPMAGSAGAPVVVVAGGPAAAPQPTQTFVPVAVPAGGYPGTPPAFYSQPAPPPQPAGY